MTGAASLLPQMVTIPSGLFNGRTIDAFQLSRTPVTNAEYAAHVDRFLSTPYVLLHTDPGTHETSILCRTRSPEEAIGDFAKYLPELSEERKGAAEFQAISGFCFGVFTLFKLSKELSVRMVDDEEVHPLYPVEGASWFHAFEYCAANGFYLPSDDQWSYAAGVHEGRKYATETETDPVFTIEGKVDVNDPRVPDGYRGLRFMTGYLSEWTARNPSEKVPYGVRGGWTCLERDEIDEKRFPILDPHELLLEDTERPFPRSAADRQGWPPDNSANTHSFRVAAPLPR